MINDSVRSTKTYNIWEVHMGAIKAQISFPFVGNEKEIMSKEVTIFWRLSFEIAGRHRVEIKNVTIVFNYL